MAQNEEKRIKTLVNDTQIIVKDALTSIASSIGNIFETTLNQTQNVSEALSKDITGNINKLAKSTDYLAEAQEKANKGALRYVDITKQIQERNAKIQIIKNQIELAERHGVGNAQKLKEELVKIEGYNKDVVNSMREQLNYSKKIEKSIGITGNLVKGVGKLASKMGFDNISDTLAEANDRATDMAKKIVDSTGKAAGFGAKLKIAGSTIGFLGKSLIKNIFDPLVLITGTFSLIKKAIGFVTKEYEIGKIAAERISEENTSIARSLGLAQGAASQLASSVAGMGPSVAASKESINQIYTAMGSTEKLSTNTLRVFVKLNTFAGM